MTHNQLKEIISTKDSTWSKSILNAREVLSDKFLTDKELGNLIAHCENIDELNMIIKCLYQDSKERPFGINGIDYFYKVVNTSRYTLSEWIKAVLFFNKWLEIEKRQAPFLKQLGYLQCCEESPENKTIHYPFLALIEEMLSEHGFVG
jgi:hypothetical protein